MKRNKLKQRSREDVIVDAFIVVFSVLMFVITVYPFFYTFILSLNEGLDAAAGGIYWLPRKFTLDNYTKFFGDMKWMTAFFISVARTVLGTIVGVLFTTIVSYGLSFKELIGRRYYMIFIIICMYFSGGIIPYYMVLRSLHLVDTFWVYIIPGALNLFFVTIGISFFASTPASLREAAIIDGASELKVFTKIMLPTSKPFMATLALFIGVNHWNNWYDATFFVKTKSLRTLSYLMMEVIKTNQQTNDAVAASYQSSTTTSLSVQLAAMMISILPIICVYPFLQKYFVSGMMIGAVKE